MTIINTGISIRKIFRFTKYAKRLSSRAIVLPIFTSMPVYLDSQTYPKGALERAIPILKVSDLRVSF